MLGGWAAWASISGSLNANNHSVKHGSYSAIIITKTVNTNLVLILIFTEIKWILECHI